MIDSKIIELSVNDPAGDNPLHEIQSEFLQWVNSFKNDKGVIKIGKTDALLELLDIWIIHFEGFSLVAAKNTKSQCYIWNGLFYELKTRSFFGRFLRQILKVVKIPKLKYTTGNRDEFFKLVLDEWNLDKDVWLKINNYRNVSPFKNGYYFHKEQIFVSQEGPRGSLAPNPDYMFTTTIDAEYTPDPSPTPKFDEFINGLVPDLDDRKFVLDYLSYCLTSNIDWQIHMILVGPPNCGKSEFLLILNYLLPELTSGLSLDQLLSKKDNKFIGGDIKGKWVNNGSELTVKQLDASGVGYFKTLITERKTRAEQKGVDAYYVANMMKGVYALNETTPMVEGLDYAFFQRLKMIPTQAGHEKVIKEYMLEIFTEEGNDIASMLVQRPNPDHCRVGKGLESYDRWNLALPSGFRFAKECLIPAYEKLGTSCDHVRDIYEKWCLLKGEYIQMPSVFGKHLKTSGIEKTSYQVNHTRYRAYEVLFTEEAIKKYSIPDLDPYRPISDDSYEIQRELDFLGRK